jgi:hypothetical protein
MVCPPKVRVGASRRRLRLMIPIRPYLHIYASSNELEEVGIASLTGVNVETNPEMEALLGVSRCLLPSEPYLTGRAETLLLLPVHVHQLICVECAEPEGALVVDSQV